MELLFILLYIKIEQETLHFKLYFNICYFLFLFLVNPTAPNNEVAPNTRYPPIVDASPVLTLLLFELLVDEFISSFTISSFTVSLLLGFDSVLVFESSGIWVSGFTAEELISFIKLSKTLTNSVFEFFTLTVT